MIGQDFSPDSLRRIVIIIVICFSPLILSAADHNHPYDCVNLAVKRIMEIRSLPEKEHLLTLDGQRIPLKEFYAKCNYLFPHCCLFRKFYYWRRWDT